MMTTEHRAEELLQRAADDLRGLTEALGGAWEFADHTPFDIDRFASASNPQPCAREVDGALVTVGYRYSAVVVRPSAAGGSPSAPSSAGLVESAVSRCGFAVVDTGPLDRDTLAVTAEDDDGARLSLRNSTSGLTLIYSSPCSTDPSLPAKAQSQASDAFAARRRADAGQNPYLDGVYAERDAERDAERRSR
jgi:hypothetical protein